MRAENSGVFPGRGCGRDGKPLWLPPSPPQGGRYFAAPALAAIGFGGSAGLKPSPLWGGLGGVFIWTTSG
ncbi:hypothetical protein FNA46_22950 [Rhizobium straminoryzae]|uniref:Uncharacterized protein n=1 Tax=Rhizobium straminoryzae TaxID=1387186 RepID=A0A549SV37_9HYPH|nr:hypothetical protein FNA46_22950 [Rhizobium straminoryzae]